MGLALKTPAADLPVSLEQAKTHLKVTGDTQNAEIMAYLDAAIQKVQADAAVQLLEATWTLTLERFPAGSGAIYFPRPPLISVETLGYTDSAGDPQTLVLDTDYTVIIDERPGYAVPAYGLAWPSTRDIPQAVTIDYKAGWTQANLPEAARAAIRLYLAQLYLYRAPVEEIAGQLLPIPDAYDSLINIFSYKGLRT